MPQSKQSTSKFSRDCREDFPYNKGFTVRYGNRLTKELKMIDYTRIKKYKGGANDA